MPQQFVLNFQRKIKEAFDPNGLGDRNYPWLPEGWGQQKTIAAGSAAVAGVGKPWNRYFQKDAAAKADPISGQAPDKLLFCAGGEWKVSKTAKYMPCFDPSTGAVIAQAPCCTAEEVEETIAAAAKAFPAWRDTPVAKRVQVLFRMKMLSEHEHLDELTELLARENGKKWGRGAGRRP